MKIVKKIKKQIETKSTFLKPWLLSVIIFAAAFLCGWIGKSFFPPLQDQITAKRMTGYKFISPLLACDMDHESNTARFKKLEATTKDIIEQKVQANDITTASVYFRDLKSSDEMVVGKDEKYYPASLNKIPLMVDYYKISETNPAILSQKAKLQQLPDSNAGQEIMPKDYLKAGSTYSIEEMIEKLIKYSDNIAFDVLTQSADQQKLEAAYEDLKLPLPKAGPNYQDFINVRDFSYFLRVLYNATYLDKDLSEKALDLLSKTDFKDGIVAGVPTQVTVAHKFGLLTLNDENGNVAKRELHDCGIVYHAQNPYLLCVMTKSTGNIKDNEKAIKDISAAVYKEVDAGYK